MPRKRHASQNRSGPAAAKSDSIRIVGGKFRGRSLAYPGRPDLRPMKDRVREAVFNLVGPAVADRQVFDLFAGTGALGLEALSRGALHATMVERHFPTYRSLQQNVQTLQLGQQATTVFSDAFLWAGQQWSEGQELPPPWLVFCSPPYDFFVQRQADMLDLIRLLCLRAPAESLLVVESDQRFPVEQLPANDAWDVRTYSPAVISLAQLPLPEMPLPEMPLPEKGERL